MAVYYDEEGNPIQGALSPEEAKALQEKADKTETLEKSIAEKEIEMEKLKAKDFNFKGLRQMSKEEKQKALEDMDEKQRQLVGEIDEMRTERENEKKTLIEEAKTEILESLSSGDEDLQKKIEFEFGLLNMPADTPKQLKEKYRKAFDNTGANAPMAINPLNVGLPTQGSGDFRRTTSKKEYGLTEDGKDLARKLGLSYVKNLDAKK